MIKQITLQDFFSFKGVNKIALNQGINVLLGINGSGKSSFLNAFKLLYDGVCGQGFEALFQQQWGGFNQVVNLNEKPSSSIQLLYVFDCEYLKKINPASPFRTDVYYRITINPLGTAHYTIEESLYTKDFSYLDFNNGNGKLSEKGQNGEVSLIEYYSNDLSGQELVISQIKDPMRYLSIHIIRKAIESMSIYSEFDINTIRKPQTESGSLFKLKPTGENLAQLLNYIKNNRVSSYEKIETNLPKINPVYKGIEIPYRGGGQLGIALREKGLDKTIEALHLSDGTLRYLLLMAIFCNPDRGFFIGIDEPECGLHPDMIKSVCDMMKEAKNSQIILATHSPLVLNHFELDDILVFEKNKLNETVVKRMSEDDFPEWEGDFLPGQMWLRGQIGGKRW